MKKFVKQFILLASFVTLVSLSFGQAPPPPSHSQNGNQASPGGTGCPIDRTDGIIMTLVLSFAYAGFALYKRGKEKKELQ
jgi:hypothetical protein